MKNIPNPPTTKVAKLMYVPKNKGESSSKENVDIKSISVRLNFFAIIKEPFAPNEFLAFLPRSLNINKKKEAPKGYKCSIEELPTEGGNT